METYTEPAVSAGTILQYLQAERIAAQNLMDRLEQVDCTTSTAHSARGIYQGLWQAEQTVRALMAGDLGR